MQVQSRRVSERTYGEEMDRCRSEREAYKQKPMREIGELGRQMEREGLIYKRRIKLLSSRYKSAAPSFPSALNDFHSALHLSISPLSRRSPSAPSNHRISRSSSSTTKKLLKRLNAVSKLACADARCSRKAQTMATAVRTNTSRPSRKKASQRRSCVWKGTLFAKSVMYHFVA